MTTTLDRSRSDATLAPPSPNSTLLAVVLLGLLGAALWSIYDLKINVATLLDSVDNARDFVRRCLPLDFPPIGEVWRLMALTLAIVALATLLSVVLSIVVAVLAARNTSPGPAARGGARAIIVAARAVPDLVLAVFFVSVFGVLAGPLAGVLAMGLHSVGMIGKLYADAIEDIDEGPREALRAAGAGPIQQLVGGVLPQVAPALVATALHRFDINLRVSVILGVVGIQGIGAELYLRLSSLQYQRGMALALIILALCIVVELISGAVRQALLGRTAQRPSARSVSYGPADLSPRWDFERVRKLAYVTITVVFLLAAFRETGITFSQIFGGLSDFATTVDLFLPPATGEEHGVGWSGLLGALGKTVEIALAATLLGLILALPVGALAARNVSPPRIALAFRTMIVVIRGIPELILAIVFIVITSLGAVAGTLALAVGAVGLLGKLVADSLEETDIRVQEAVSTVGATPLQVFFAATARQGLPAIAAHVLYQLDVNIRNGTLLGIVGAGGIGLILLDAKRILAYDVIAMIVIVVFAVIIVVELLSMWVRRTLDGPAR